MPAPAVPPCLTQKSPPWFYGGFYSVRFRPFPPAVQERLSPGFFAGLAPSPARCIGLADPGYSFPHHRDFHYHIEIKQKNQAKA